jgi:adenylate cyclase
VARVRSMLRMKALHERVQAQADERLGRLKRFFSPAVADLIVGGDADDLLRTHRREVAMVVTDLTGFVPFAETAEPEEILGLLREYHAAMGRLVLGHEATLERIVVDGVVAVFNAPVEVADPAGRAVRLAVALRERARELNAAWRRRGWDLPVRIGVGLGYATIGAVGFEERLDYAVVGHVAAVSAFLCDAAGPDDILVALRVATAVETLADLEEIAPIERPGLVRPIRAFRVRGLTS